MANYTELSPKLWEVLQNHETDIVREDWNVKRVLDMGNGVIEEELLKNGIDVGAGKPGRKNLAQSLSNFKASVRKQTSSVSGGTPFGALPALPMSSHNFPGECPQILYLKTTTNYLTSPPLFSQTQATIA